MRLDSTKWDTPPSVSLTSTNTTPAAAPEKSGTITLLVSHRFATVRMADLIVYLEEGHATEAGTHDELVAGGGRYAELFTLQASGYR